MSTDNKSIAPFTVWFGLPDHREVRAGLRYSRDGVTRFVADGTGGDLTRSETELFSTLVADLSMVARGDYHVTVEYSESTLTLVDADVEAKFADEQPVDGGLLGQFVLAGDGGSVEEALDLLCAQGILRKRSIADLQGGGI
ncbi:hypothetical protein CH267_00785 [Rhodococcus sp. 06-621-2]|nr:hypothetical protein [Rhodococcus sp. 06-621-2]OZC62110.1 hypothetical protein CH267_00785 [Rhodococcus sp. 06-621-2]